MGLLGGASNAADSWNSAQSARAMGDYQARTMEMNARNADFQAEDALARGDKAAAQHKTKTNQMIGAQRNALAAQGVDIDSGSAMDVQTDAATLGAEDAATIRGNAWREAWGFRSQAQQFRHKGEFLEKAGKDEARMTLLTGGMKAITAGASSYMSAGGKFGGGSLAAGGKKKKYNFANADGLGGGITEET
jgi:hypothetical protein